MSKIGAKVTRQRKEQVAEIMAHLKANPKLELGQDYLVGQKLMKAVEKELSKPVRLKPKPSVCDPLEDHDRKLEHLENSLRESKSIPSPAATRLKYMGYAGLALIVFWLFLTLIQSLDQPTPRGQGQTYPPEQDSQIA